MHTICSIELDWSSKPLPSTISNACACSRFGAWLDRIWPSTKIKFRQYICSRWLRPIRQIFRLYSNQWYLCVKDTAPRSRTNIKPLIRKRRKVLTITIHWFESCLGPFFPTFFFTVSDAAKGCVQVFNRTQVYQWFFSCFGWYMYISLGALQPSLSGISTFFNHAHKSRSTDYAMCTWGMCSAEL